MSSILLRQHSQETLPVPTAEVAPLKTGAGTPTAAALAPAAPTVEEVAHANEAKETHLQLLRQQCPSLPFSAGSLPCAAAAVVAGSIGEPVAGAAVVVKEPAASALCNRVTDDTSAAGGHTASPGIPCFAYASVDASSKPAVAAERLLCDTRLNAAAARNPHAVALSNVAATAAAVATDATQNAALKMAEREWSLRHKDSNDTSRVLLVEDVHGRASKAKNTTPVFEGNLAAERAAAMQLQGYKVDCAMGEQKNGTIRAPSTRKSLSRTTQQNETQFCDDASIDEKESMAEKFVESFTSTAVNCISPPRAVTVIDGEGANSFIFAEKACNENLEHTNLESVTFALASHSNPDLQRATSAKMAAAEAEGRPHGSAARETQAAAAATQQHHGRQDRAAVLGWDCLQHGHAKPIAGMPACSTCKQIPADAAAEVATANCSLDAHASSSDVAGEKEERKDSLPYNSCSKTFHHSSPTASKYHHSPLPNDTEEPLRLRREKADAHAAVVKTLAEQKEALNTQKAQLAAANTALFGDTAAAASLNSGSKARPTSSRAATFMLWRSSSKDSNSKNSSINFFSVPSPAQKRQQHRGEIVLKRQPLQPLMSPSRFVLKENTTSAAARPSPQVSDKYSFFLARTHSLDAKPPEEAHAPALVEPSAGAPSIGRGASLPTVIFAAVNDDLDTQRQLQQPQHPLRDDFKDSGGQTIHAVARVNSVASFNSGMNVVPNSSSNSKDPVNRVKSRISAVSVARRLYGMGRFAGFHRYGGGTSSKTKCSINSTSRNNASSCNSSSALVDPDNKCSSCTLALSPAEADISIARSTVCANNAANSNMLNSLKDDFSFFGEKAEGGEADLRYLKNREEEDGAPSLINLDISAAGKSPTSASLVWKVSDRAAQSPGQASSCGRAGFGKLTDSLVEGPSQTAADAAFEGSEGTVGLLRASTTSASSGSSNTSYKSLSRAYGSSKSWRAFFFQKDRVIQRTELPNRENPSRFTDGGAIATTAGVPLRENFVAKAPRGENFSVLHRRTVTAHVRPSPPNYVPASSSNTREKMENSTSAAAFSTPPRRSFTANASPLVDAHAASVHANDPAAAAAAADARAAAASVLLSATWIDIILPDWENQRNTARFTKLLHEGVPHEVRGEVWKKAVGDDLQITPRFYEMLLRRAQHAREYLMRTSKRYRDRINETMQTEEAGGGGTTLLPFSAICCGENVAAEHATTATAETVPAARLEAETWSAEAAGCRIACDVLEPGGCLQRAEKITPTAGCGSLLPMMSKQQAAAVASSGAVFGRVEIIGAAVEHIEHHQQGVEDVGEKKTVVLGDLGNAAETALLWKKKSVQVKSAASVSHNLRQSEAADKRDVLQEQPGGIAACGDVSKKSQPVADAAATGGDRALLQLLQQPRLQMQQQLNTSDESECDSKTETFLILSTPPDTTAGAVAALDAGCCACCRTSKEADPVTSEDVTGGEETTADGSRVSSTAEKATASTQSAVGGTASAAVSSSSSSSAVQFTSFTTTADGVQVDAQFKTCGCGFFNWEDDIYSAFQLISLDLHRTLPRLGACHPQVSSNSFFSTPCTRLPTAARPAAQSRHRSEGAGASSSKQGCCLAVSATAANAAGGGTCATETGQSAAFSSTASHVVDIAAVDFTAVVADKPYADDASNIAAAAATACVTSVDTTTTTGEAVAIQSNCASDNAIVFANTTNEQPAATVSAASDFSSGFSSSKKSHASSSSTADAVAENSTAAATAGMKATAASTGMRHNTTPTPTTITTTNVIASTVGVVQFASSGESERTLQQAVEQQRDSNTFLDNLQYSSSRSKGSSENCTAFPERKDGLSNNGVVLEIVEEVSAAQKKNEQTQLDCSTNSCTTQNSTLAVSVVTEIAAQACTRVTAEPIVLELLPSVDDAVVGGTHALSAGVAVDSQRAGKCQNSAATEAVITKAVGDTEFVVAAPSFPPNKKTKDGTIETADALSEDAACRIAVPAGAHEKKTGVTGPALLVLGCCGGAASNLHGVREEAAAGGAVPTTDHTLDITAAPAHDLEVVVAEADSTRKNSAAARDDAASSAVDFAEAEIPPAAATSSPSTKPQKIFKAAEIARKKHDTAACSCIVDKQAVAPVPFSLPASTMLYEYLRCVLEAYTMFRPDVGYVQGMAYIAATLLLYMDEYSAFVCFSNLLVRRPLHAFYTFDMNVVEVYFRTFDTLLMEKLPGVWMRLKELGIQTDVFLVEWMYTLFTRCLPFELVGRIWDHFFIEGEYILIQTSLTILAYFQNNLLHGTIDDCMSILSSSSTTHFQALQGDKFFECFHNMSITPQRFKSLMETVQQKLAQQKRRQQKIALTSKGATSGAGTATL